MYLWAIDIYMLYTYIGLYYEITANITKEMIKFITVFVCMVSGGPLDVIYDINNMENGQFSSTYISKRQNHVWDIAGLDESILFPEDWWEK